MDYNLDKIAQPPNWNELPHSTTVKMPSMDGKLTHANFVKLQKGIAETFRITGVVLAVTLSVLLVRFLYTIDDRYFGAKDSVVAATIRSGTIFTIPTVIWIAWYSFWQKRGVVYKAARCLRGFLARNLSPVWVSWLYEAKRKPTRIHAVEQTDRTIERVLVDHWLLLALFLICIVFFANTAWLEGKYNVDTVPRYPHGKTHWVNYVVHWLFQHPTSTLFIAAPLGSWSVAVFAYRLLKLIKPKFAAVIAIALFFVSILLFAARAAA